MKHLDKLNDKNVDLVSTGTTGAHAEKEGLIVTRFNSEPIGGDAEIAARIVQRKTDVVLFFKNPLGKYPHEPNVAMLMRLCDVHNVPLATNPATAELLIKSL